MKKEELKQFLELYDKFEDTCLDIRNELSYYDSDFKYVDEFYIDDKRIRCEGDEYWSYGGHEHHTKYFNIDLLTYSDDELKEYVSNIILEESEKKAKELAEKEKYKKEQELKELKRLKEKYEKQTIYIN